MAERREDEPRGVEGLDENPRRISRLRSSITKAGNRQQSTIRNSHVCLIVSLLISIPGFSISNAEGQTYTPLEWSDPTIPNFPSRAIWSGWFNFPDAAGVVRRKLPFACNFIGSDSKSPNQTYFPSGLTRSRPWIKYDRPRVLTEILSREAVATADQSLISKMFRSRKEKTCIRLFREDLVGGYGDTARFENIDVFELLFVNTGGLSSDGSDHFVWGIVEIEGSWSGRNY
jgi:hypothetical protein